MLSIHKKPTLQIGVWKMPQIFGASEKMHWHFAWLDPSEQCHFYSSFNPSLAELQRAICSSLKIKKTPKLKFITAILPHKLLHRTLIFPPTTQAREAEMQCMLALKNDLPVPLDDVWFDFIMADLPHNKGIRIDLFAIVKSLAREYRASFQPFKLDVLDCASNVLHYAFAYLLPKEERSPHLYNVLCLYQTQDFALAFLEQPMKCLILQKNQGDALSLYQEFCEKYDIKAEKVLFFGEKDSPALAQMPVHWQDVSQPFSLMALGCALWETPIENFE